MDCKSSLFYWYFAYAIVSVLVRHMIVLALSLHLK